MSDDGTERKIFRLPTALDLPRERLRVIPPAQSDFVSQLIAERQHLPPQRERRRAPVVEAVSAYDKGARITARRMPAGYRKTIVT